ncbi:MAG TPA: hypothetical protein VL460_10485 [Caulobacteraceae bacterium]|jgi:hypothetical protein|nr:hypothetical protein [Caulobacteraceae bacterium]
MSRKVISILGAAALAALGLPTARAAPIPPTPASPAASAAPAPPAPAFSAGSTVVDSQGVVLGSIEGLAQGQGDEMVVVVKIDGKLVSIPESTLRLAGGGAVSSQTKAQILAAAGAQR